MFLKHQPNKGDKPTTTDQMEESQKLSDSWFEKGLPVRPKDKITKDKPVEKENEKSAKTFAYE